MRYPLIHLVSAFLLSATLHAFSEILPAPGPGEVGSLLRIQRTLRANSVCVLLRQDGQFHLETTHGDHTKVFAGSLPSLGLAKVRSMLDNDGLLKLTSEPAAPQGSHLSQILQVSIFRQDHWQDLIFMETPGSQSVPQTVGPLLQWFDDLHKQRKQRLKEDQGKNHCQPPASVELKKRP